MNATIFQWLTYAVGILMGIASACLSNNTPTGY